MTDYLQVDADTVQAPTAGTADSGFACSECGTVTPTEHGLKIHLSRVHGIKQPASTIKTPKAETADQVTVKKEKRSTPGSAKKPLFSKSKRLSNAGRDLTIDLIAAAVAWAVVRWIQSRQIVVSRSEQEQFILSPEDRVMMLKPLMDLLETVTPAVQVINSIAERFDYIQCFLLWRMYLQSVGAFVAERKEHQNNGNLGQSTTAYNRQTNGEDEGGSGFQRQYSSADYIA